MEIRTAIDRLDQDIRQLKIDFERFFNGGLPTPPEDFRQEVRRQIRRLRSTPIQALVDRFRLNTLEARFNTLDELFNRRLRDREEGIAARAAPPAQTLRHYDPYQGIVVGTEPASEAIQAIYEELYRAQRTGRGANFERFESYLLGQMAEIRKRTGCDEVKFRVSSEGGKLKLKAKPVRHPRMPAPGGLHDG